VGSASVAYTGAPQTVSLTVTPSSASSVVVLTYTSASPSYNSTTGPTHTGTYTATASLSDSTNYAFTGDSVNPGTLTINPAPVRKIFADPDFAVSALTGSGLTASLTGNTNSICTVTDNGNGTATVHILAAGSCSITASQPGSSNHSAAAPVTGTITINPARVQTVLSNTNGTYPASAFGQTIALQAHVTDIDHNVALSSGYVEIKAFCRLKDEDTATGPCSPAVVLDVTPTSWNGDTLVLTPTLALNTSGIATVSMSTLPVGGPGFIKAIYHPAAANYAMQPYDSGTIDDNKSDQATLTSPNVYTGAWDFLNQQVTQASS